MIATHKSVRTLCSATLLVAVIAAQPARAQAVDTPAMEPEPETLVIIRAEQPTKVVSRSRFGEMPVELYALSYHVSYADLDLGTDEGASALKKRVRTAAQSACKDLGKIYPRLPRDPSCSRKAEDGAQPQIDKAITAAVLRQKRPTG